MIAIYEKDGSQNLVNIVSSIESAAAWIGCGVRILYYNLKIDGVMHYDQYFIERV